MLVVAANIESSARLFPDVRRRGQRTEVPHRGQVRLHDVHAFLIRVLEVAEEVDLVLLDRTAEDAAGLLPGEFRIVGQRIASQARIGGHLVVAMVVVPGAAKIVRAGARHDVDRAEGRDARREVEVRGRDLELLHYLLREILGGAAGHRVADVAAVDGNRRA